MKQVLGTSALVALAVGCCGAWGQGSADQILARADVKAAMTAIQASDAHFVDEQVRLCEIASPPFHEDKRAAEVARLFKAAGLQNVRMDKAGNVLGERPGAAAHPHLVMAAHLDTVFPEGTDVHVTRTGNVLKGPGIGDDCRGLAAVLQVVHAMNEAHLKTKGVGDVCGEHGRGRTG